MIKAVEASELKDRGHIQLDGRHLSMWCGFILRQWAIAFVLEFDRDDPVDSPVAYVQLGPLYCGAGR